jgi:hypothetical protein
VAPLDSVRNEFEEIIKNDLLGPWQGKDEVILQAPKSRYLVGMLAPIIIDAEETLPEEDEKGAIDDEGSNTSIGEEQIDSGDASEADEDKGTITNSVRPSSMGLRCQVGNEVLELKAVAKWGRYIADNSTNPDGTTVKQYTREQVIEPVKIDLRKENSKYSLANGLAEFSVEVIRDKNRKIIEIALLNSQKAQKKAPATSWMYQVEFELSADNEAEVFLPSSDVIEEGIDESDEELRRLSLLYRNRLEFAIGRACSASSIHNPKSRKATKVFTTWLPTVDVPQTRAFGSSNLLVSMKKLAEATTDELDKGLRSLIQNYAIWIDEQEVNSKKLPQNLPAVAIDPIANARWTKQRLEEGLNLLLEKSDHGDQARKAFAFMNQAMYEQRIHSEIGIIRASDPDITFEDAKQSVTSMGDSAAAWRPFQLAFILKQIPAMVKPESAIRSGQSANAELLFFPTGGGKTEAYLGLSAFTFAIRRIQNLIETKEGVINGGEGVGVLMRYTLRLLTSQQFVRATTLVCAAELIRQSDPKTWGSEPFRIGLWVGSNVSPKSYEDAKRQIEDARQDDGTAHGLTVLQVKRCPWCGTPIRPKSDLIAKDSLRRVFVYCGDQTGGCPFSATSIEGLPLLTVDEEIYRYPPTFLLATVDKFARLAREGQAASLFGYVNEKCERHGFRHEDTIKVVCSDANSHAPKVAENLAASNTVKVSRLRPPDLVIQDELHLISGALGTAVGLFESVIDIASSWKTVDGQNVKPLVVASTATVRNAEQQVRRLYGRGIEVFPPQVLDIEDTFFSKEVEISEENPGRRYMGICAPGIRMIISQIQIFTILQLAAQKLFDQYGNDADAYMTSVAYFNATRELAGMRRHLDDSVATKVSNRHNPHGLKRRTSSVLNVGELTSRISSADIASTLDTLGLGFEPEKDSSAAKESIEQAIKNAKAEGKKFIPPKRVTRPFDVVLATSMLQVGVDVPRLGTMLVVGQPKNTAEYIQASSRVGRSPDKHGPGLVLTLANWARPRDMAHFEQFDFYHRTFYSNVEALSVTPFSDASLERGLTAVLVSAARIIDAVSTVKSLSPNLGAGKAKDKRNEVLDQILDEIVSRSIIASQSDEIGEKVRIKLTNRIDRWVQKSEEGIAYQAKKDKNQVLTSLLISPEEVRDTAENRMFRVANSMREVQAELNLIYNRIIGSSPDFHGGPKWNFPKAKKDLDD